jgi:hypothetical protein
VLKGRGDELVSGLAACQKKIGTNYLSAYPSDIFEHLAQGKPAWAPFYTYHKIMAGLLDMHQLTGNTDALKVAEGMAVWAQEYFTGISTDQRLRILRDEYGGMNEVLVNLAAVTKKIAILKPRTSLSSPASLIRWPRAAMSCRACMPTRTFPRSSARPACTKLPAIAAIAKSPSISYAEVLDARSYVIGNTSQDEHWKSPAGHLEGTLEWTNAECCVAYNLMKLQRHVFSWTGDARWMDAYERALFNCRLGTQNAQGLKQYFFPLAARLLARVQLTRRIVLVLHRHGRRGVRQVCGHDLLPSGQRHLCQPVHRIHAYLERRRPCFGAGHAISAGAGHNAQDQVFEASAARNPRAHSKLDHRGRAGEDQRPAD